MHVVVLGAIGHFYTMQVALTNVRASNRATEYFLAELHLDMHFWRELYKSIDTHPIYLEDIVHRDVSDLGYCNVSGIGAVGVWIDPNKDRFNRVCQIQWPVNVVTELVRFQNPKGDITN